MVHRGDGPSIGKVHCHFRDVPSDANKVVPTEVWQLKKKSMFNLLVMPKSVGLAAELEDILRPWFN